MKAISLWQPWASLIAEGVKTAETRTWATSYRGPLLICAAKRVDADELGLIVMACSFAGQRRQFDLPFPRGVAVAVADLVTCEPMRPGDQLLACVPFEAGRWCWFLENVRKLREPLPFRGRQGLFNVARRTVAVVRALLEVGAGEADFLDTLSRGHQEGDL